MGDQRGVVGIGYEGREIGEFIRVLLAEEVTIVVDVRLNALSRKRGFSKNGLRAALAEADIEYFHRPALGNPRENRDGFAVPGSRAGDAARSVYGEILRAPTAEKALHEVATLARSRRVAVMCFESDQHACHRELVIESLESQLNERLRPVSI
ncbi:DUF488 family protein [Microcella sp.]|uniref:DUF488 domain-containing protein n=1 Tax=Microcella sp. TaxID=1913979 RepID=UPI00256E3AB1|nr:DUF488 domain-containing protein [Microcella sp.]MBX9471412.1 DUF488 domain-containing protein [Microcella sp.]MBX9473102.1 DUF488 domain-containing protein [Microcella sp.]